MAGAAEWRRGQCTLMMTWRWMRTESRGRGAATAMLDASQIRIQARMSHGIHAPITTAERLGWQERLGADRDSAGPDVAPQVITSPSGCWAGVNPGGQQHFQSKLGPTQLCISCTHRHACLAVCSLVSTAGCVCIKKPCQHQIRSAFCATITFTFTSSWVGIDQHQKTGQQLVVSCLVQHPSVSSAPVGPGLRPSSLLSTAP